EPRRVAVPDPRHVGGRGEETEGATVNEGKIPREPAVELHGGPIACPDGVPIHPDRRHLTRKTHADAGPIRARSIVGDLPRTPAADHRKDEATPRLDQA